MTSLCASSLHRSSRIAFSSTARGQLFAPLHSGYQRAHFVTNPFASPAPQTLTASRTLPYPASAIYDIIADVPRYSSFLPFCQASRVTKWSAPDEITGRSWPSEADLVVGWGGIMETFSSRIYCVPGSIVEAVGGRSRTRLSPDSIKHHLADPSADLDGLPAGEDAILTHLSTRWTVRPLPSTPSASSSSSPQANERTAIDVAIEFQFANPMYNVMSAAATPKVAEMMVRAFEERVEQLLAHGESLEAPNPLAPGESKLSRTKQTP